MDVQIYNPIVKSHDHHQHHHNIIIIITTDGDYSYIKTAFFIRTFQMIQRQTNKREGRKNSGNESKTSIQSCFLPL